MQIRLVRWTTCHILVLIFAESLVTLSADFRISIRICENQGLVLEKLALKCLTRDLPVYIRGDIKYYFADFVRKGGTPPPLWREKNFAKKKVTDLLKMLFFAQKTPVFGQKNRLRIWGVSPPPLYGQNPQSSI